MRARRYRAMWRTPLGYRFADLCAPSCDEARAVARWRCRDGVGELGWGRELRPDSVGDQRAEERGSEPPRASEDRLDPGVVTSGEHDEPRGHGHVGDGPVFVSEGHLLLVGEPDKVKVIHLTEHACLVRGYGDVKRLRTVEEVADLARVLADAEEVPEQVGGDGVHGPANRGTGA